MSAFDTLFKKPSALCRHKNAPYRAEREQYLAHCIKEGYSRGYLQIAACEILWAAFKMKARYPDLRLTREQIKAVARNWGNRKRSSGQKMTFRATHVRFIKFASRWLKFLGLLCRPLQPKKPVPWQKFLDEYARWVREDRGLASATITVQSRYIKYFLWWYRERKRPFSSIRISELDSFLASCGARNWTRVTISDCASSLRSFFRYAGQQGWCQSSIANGIEGPRIYSKGNVPAGPPWEDVRRLLKSTENSRPYNIRARAVLLLLAVYGLRVGEVCKLHIDDIDWENNRISIWRLKREQFQFYPLVLTVGNAIIQYLRLVRPRSQHRELFLSLMPPFRPMTRSAAYQLTCRRMMKLKIQTPHYGPHSLRHACASHLLAEKFTLKEIGDHLGHRSLQATQIYAKVDLSALREVASLDLSPLLFESSRRFIRKGRSLS